MDITNSEAERSAKVVEHPDINGVKIIQAGRVVRMQGDLGTTFFIDVTERPDPTTIDSENPNDKGEIVGEMLKGELQRRNNTWNHNNGVIVLVTDKFSHSDIRIYVGVSIVNEDDTERKDVTGYVVDQAGFRQSGGYVPMSFDGSNAAASIIMEEIQEAVGEVGTSTDFANPTALQGLQALLTDGNE